MTGLDNELTYEGLLYVFVLLLSVGIIGVFFLIALVMHALVPPPHRPKYGVYDVRDYKTEEWRLLRSYVIDDREHGRCQYCGGKAQTAHHLSYHQGVICNPRFLQAVCWPCHRGIHNGSIQQIDTSEGELTDFEIEQVAKLGEDQLNGERE